MSFWEFAEIGAEWDTEWDALASQSPAAGFMQSSAWAAFKRAEGYETTRFGFLEEGRLRGGASLLLYSPSAESAAFLLCPEGPVIPWQDEPRARECLRALSAYAEEAAKTRPVVGLRIEPHLSPPRPSLLRNWTRAPVDLTPVHTLVVDLTLPEAEQRRRMPAKARYNLALSERAGVQVVCSTKMSDWQRFYPLFEATARRQGFFAEPYGFFLNLGAALFPGGEAALLLAEWEGQTLAAHVVIFYGHRATYLYGGSSLVARQVMPGYALYHAAMQEARRRGCLEYDLFGYDPFGHPNHLYAGISRFKSHWSGTRRDSVGAHDLLFYDPLADRIIRHWAGASGTAVSSLATTSTSPSSSSSSSSSSDPPS